MPEPHQSREEKAAARAAAQPSYKRLCSAYLEVFGRDEMRTPAQKLVMQNMEYRGYIHRTTMVPTREGIVQQEKMEHAEGQRSFVLETKNFIREGYTASIATSSDRKA